MYVQCDLLYKVYIEKLQNPFCTDDDIDMAYNSYQNSRNKLNAEVFSIQEKDYRCVMEMDDERQVD